MRLSVDHVTRYRYEAPVRGVQQSHRLTPADFDGQKVISWAVDVSGGIKGGTFRDGAGDRMQAWSVPGPVEEVTVTVRGTVETNDTAGVLKGLRETVTPACYLIETQATEIEGTLQALADAIEADGPLALAHKLSAAVSRAVAYKPGVTHAATTAAEALALGEGVCQDHAHVLIACARARGLPARYVSGYLFTAKDGTPHEAAHAWAEIHISGLGWVGFDPANECCPDERYIRLGSGFDAQDAAPIRGIARGQVAVAPEALDVEVQVVAGAQQAQGQSQ
ncbi:transglutaminase domain-containing protein [Neotabrizicola sp. sgz301269]|uniref:transglutaminase family protein n=1 Tax=Neotabrizicola sp. sgz301269 TaxID=3276282 RepID=UPI0037701675